MYDRAEGSVHPGPLLKLRVSSRKTQAGYVKVKDVTPAVGVTVTLELLAIPTEE